MQMGGHIVSLFYMPVNSEYFQGKDIISNWCEAFKSRFFLYFFSFFTTMSPPLGWLRNSRVIMALDWILMD